MGNLSRLFFKIAITDTTKTLGALRVSAFQEQTKKALPYAEPFSLDSFSNFDKDMIAQLLKFDYAPMLWRLKAWLVYRKPRQLYLSS